MYKAKRLPVHKGVAAWNAILPSRAAHGALDEKVTADFCIIGAGFAGLSAARRLTQLDPSARVVVLDAGTIGEGASGRNSGFMIDLPHDLTSDDYAGSGETSEQALIALNRRAIAFAREAVEEYDIDRNFFDPAGKVNAAASSKGDAANQQYTRHLSSLGERFEWLDQQAMRELTGSDYFVSGVYTPGTVMLQPAGYIRGLAGGVSAGARIFENTPALGFKRQGKGWDVETPEGSVSAGAVILANNGHLESFGFKANRLMHVFLFAAMTQALNAREGESLKGAPRWGVTPSDPMGTTVRRIDAGQGGDRIVVRSCAEFRPDMVATDRGMARARRVLRRKFDARFPKLAGIEMEHIWAGHLCLSKNAVSVTGRLDDGLYAACCQNGLGTARGTLTGIAAAEVALGQQSDITRFFAGQDEPQKLPPAPISSIGANVYLRFKEHKARFE